MEWPLDPPSLDLGTEAPNREEEMLILQRDIQQSMRRIAITLERLLFLYSRDIEHRDHTV